MLTSAVEKEQTGKWKNDYLVYLNSLGLVIKPTVLVDGDGAQMGTAANPLITADFLLEVARGNVPGHSLIHKFGRHTALPLNTQTTISHQGGIYPGFNQVTPDTVKLTSNAAADTGTLLKSGDAKDGGTSTTLVDTLADFVADGILFGDIVINDTLQDHGFITGVTTNVLTVWRFARDTIPVNGNLYRVVTAASTGAPVMRLPLLLDGNYDRHSEYVIMDGTNGATTSGNYIRCSRGRTIGGRGVGIIKAFPTSTSANQYFEIPAGGPSGVADNSSLVAADTIPRGCSGFIIQWFGAILSVSGVTGNINFKFYVRPIADQFKLEAEIGGFAAGSSFTPETFPAPAGPIAEMSDFRMDAIASTANMGVAARWTLLLIENNFM
jgi:hypothetical protein